MFVVTRGKKYVNDIYTALFNYGNDDEVAEEEEEEVVGEAPTDEETKETRLIVYISKKS